MLIASSPCVLSPCSVIWDAIIPKPYSIVRKFGLCEIVTVGSGLLLSSQVADSKYSYSFKGNCNGNHLENKYCTGSEHTAKSPRENV